MTGVGLPITERLREAEALKQCYQSQISYILGYTRNPDRLMSELAAEEKKLKWQQDRVDRLRFIAENDEEDSCRPWYEKLEAIKQQLIHLRHEGRIELLRQMQRTINALNADVTEEGRAALDSMRKMADPQATPKVLAACDPEVKANE